MSLKITFSHIRTNYIFTFYFMHLTETYKNLYIKLVWDTLPDLSLQFHPPNHSSQSWRRMECFYIENSQTLILPFSNSHWHGVIYLLQIFWHQQLLYNFDWNKILLMVIDPWRHIQCFIGVVVAFFVVFQRSCYQNMKYIKILSFY